MKEFKISKGTVAGIKKAKEEIRDIVAQNLSLLDPHTTRLKDVAAKLDGRVYNWFCKARSRGLIVTGPMIQQKATIAAASLGMSTFKSSNGWLQRFQKRHCISWRTISGQALKMPVDVVENWKVMWQVYFLVLVLRTFTTATKRVFLAWAAKQNTFTEG